MSEIKYLLLSNQDLEYQKFIKKLIPKGGDNLIGVRMPVLTAMAKNFIKDKNLDYFWQNITDSTYEEIMLQARVIGYSFKKNLEETLDRTETFLPKIDNWAVCDSFVSSLKSTKKYQAEVWSFLEKYFKDKRAYYLRFVAVMMLNYFLDESYIEKVFSFLDSTKHEDYYVNIAISWALAECYLKYPEKTLKYFQNNNLEKSVYNKALQKITESNKISKAEKEDIKKLKRL